MKWMIRGCLLALGMLSIASSVYAVDFEWRDQKGVVHQLDELKGKPVLIHLWASWCFPCRAEMPGMSAWLSNHPEVTVLPVSLDESAANANAFLMAIDWKVPLMQTDASQLYRLGSRGLPTTVLINSAGEVESVHAGVQQWQDGAWSDRVLALFRPTS